MQTRGTNVAISALLAPVLADPGVDAAVLITGAFSGGGTDFDPAGLGDILRAHDKPVLAWLYGPSKYVRAWEESLARIGVPTYANLGMVASALAGINALAAHRARHRAPAIPREKPCMEPAAKIFAAVRARGAKTLTEPEGYRLLESVGLRAPRWEVAADEREAVAAARRIGFPVVLKVVSRDIAHKTDVGGVAAGLANDASVAAATRSMQASLGKAAPGAHIEGFLIQQMVKSRTEVIVGMTNSPQFGPAIMVGLGGIFVEAIGHVEFALPPFDEQDVDRMIERTGLGKVLGARGGMHNADRAAIRSAVLSLGDLAESNLGIEQIEVNPLIVLPDAGGIAAVDALIVIR